MIHIYCGDGKGKTTASIGLAVRAAGEGLRVLFVQFMKARLTGEIPILASLDNVTVMRAKSSTKFSYEMTEEELSRLAEENRKTLDLVFGMIRSGGYDIMILDEAITAVSTDVIGSDELKSYVDGFPEDKELVLTGRTPDQWMIEAADYVTDMEKIKHPYDRGVEARKGIEY